MSRLLIIGAGGHGAVVAETAAVTRHWSKIAFLDDNLSGTILPGVDVIGTVADFGRHVEQDTEFIVALGENKKRIELLNRLQDSGAAVVSVSHPVSVISPSALIDKGSVACGGVVINARASVGRGVILNTACSIDHDCVLDDGVHVSPGANLAGNVRIGERTWVGIGSAIREGVRVGSDCIIGAGAAVVSDLPDGVTAVGVPARMLSKK